MIKRVIFLSSISFFMLGFNNLAFGVCLNGHPSVEQEFLSSTLVLEGIVKSSESVPDTEKYLGGDNYLVDITRVLKGENLPQINVFNENSSGRFPMEVGASYFLFLFEVEGRWQVSNCGNSSLSSESLDQCPLVRPDGSVEVGAAAQAVTIALPLLQNQFGDAEITQHVPFNARLDRNVWRIHGLLPRGMIGGTPEATICGSTGKVIEIYHTQ